MTDDADFDEIAGDSAAEVKAWFRRKVRTHGLRVAYNAAVSVCEDPKAPAPARAAAAGLLFRAGGVLDAKNTEDDDDTPIGQMTMAQMRARYERLEAEAAERARTETADSVFD